MHQLIPGDDLNGKMILDTLENTPEVSPRTMANRNSKGADIIFATKADVITHSVTADIRPKTIMSFLRSILSDRCPPGSVPKPSHSANTVPTIPAVVTSWLTAYATSVNANPPIVVPSADAVSATNQDR